MRATGHLTSVLLAGALLGATCHTAAPEGLWPTQRTGGPVVVFDLFARPLPEIPFPNDLATRPERGSPTGRRINASQLAPTRLESDVRGLLDRLDGWATYGSITVSFEPVERRLDLGNVLRRHTRDDFDFTDDAVYVINIDPASPDFGRPVPLDMGEGNFPVNLQERNRFYENDPRGQTNNLLFDTTFEDTNGNGELDLCEDVDRDGVTDEGEDLDGDGVAFSAETDEDGDGVLGPEEDLNGNGRLDCREDTDFDGQLDVPNLYCGRDRSGLPIPPQDCEAVTVPDPLGDVVLPADDVWLTSFYERETNTLILRPVIPLAERTPYAVVLTRRLVDEEGRAVESPFPTVHHVDQTDEARRLEAALAAHPELYGGLTVDDIQFTWAFTTQTVTSDMRDVREGLYGRGPMAALADELPQELRLDVLHGCGSGGLDCGLPDNLYVLKARGEEPGETGIIDVLEQFASVAFGVSDEEFAALADTYDYVDYVVAARFTSPNFLDNNASSEDRDGDGRLDGDEDRGNGVLDEGEDLDGDGTLDVAEDANCSGVLDEGEDLDGDGRLDVNEDLGDGNLDVNEDVNGNRELDEGEDLDGDGVLDLHDEDEDLDGHLDRNEDVNCNGVLDGEEGAFDIDTAAGRWAHGFHEVTAMIAIPKADPERGIEPPFPVVFYGHGYTSSRIESLGFAGSLAKFGFASVGVECVHHGLALDEGLGQMIELYTSLYDVTGLGRSIRRDRARDLNGDGTTDPGGDFWTAYVFHTRDVVRQSGIDHLRMIQLLRSFDGELRSGADYDGDGVEELAGDFNADGVVDLGGPGADYHVWGQSLGGIMSALLAGLEPSIVGAAPVSGGGGLGDVGIRSTQGGVREAVVLRMMGPVLLTVPASDRYRYLGCGTNEECGSGSCVGGVCRCERDAQCMGSGEIGYRCTDAPSGWASQDRVCARPRDDTQCSINEISARFLVPDLNDDGFVEYACLGADELGEGDTVVARNLINGEVGCFVAWPGGRTRIHLASDLQDAVEVSIYSGEVLVDTETCEVRDGATPAQVIDRFEVPAHFQFADWAPGDRLQAPAEGFGLRRGTPALRRFMGIAQTALEPGDPANMALHYFRDPVDYGEGTDPANVMVIATIGDMNVPVNTGIAIARAAGILDIATPDPRLADAAHPAGRTANRFLIDTQVIEGLERLSLFRRESDGAQVLFDPDDLDRSSSPPEPGWVGDAFGAPSGPVPLRSWTRSDTNDVCICRDTSGEYPCTWPGDTVAPLDMVRCDGGVSALVLPYMSAEGDHGFALPSPAKAFDVDTYMINMIGYYFSTGGTELRWDLCLATNSCTVEEQGFYVPPVPAVE